MMETMPTLFQEWICDRTRLTDRLLIMKNRERRPCGASLLIFRCVIANSQVNLSLTATRLHFTAYRTPHA